MEDRYLFKAKRIDNGEWVEGAFYIEPYTDARYIIRWNSSGLGFNEFIKVDRETICQCTGSKDKNGNLIWENDIVRVWGDTDDFGNDLYYFFKVVWNKDLCCWWLSDIYTKEDECLYMCLKEIEILGNVFDNPELLEGGE